MKHWVYTLFTVCLTFSMNLSAQPSFLQPDSIAKHTLLIQLGIGYGVGAVDEKDSMWKGVETRNDIGLSWTLNTLYCSNNSDFAYGAYYWDYRDFGKTHKLEGCTLKEKTNVHYIGPQVAYVKKQTAFDKGFGLIGLGLGYLRYASKNSAPELPSCHAHYNGVGIHASLAYHYAWAEHWGAGMEILGLYSPVRLHIDGGEPPLPLQPRKHINLFMLSMQIGISYYL